MLVLPEGLGGVGVGLSDLLPQEERNRAQAVRLSAPLRYELYCMIVYIKYLFLYAYFSVRGGYVALRKAHDRPSVGYSYRRVSHLSGYDIRETGHSDYCSILG